MSEITVDYLKRITFSLLPINEKLEIISRGRPTPSILIQTYGVSKSKKFLKNFNLEWYEKINWLCGCETTNALFCFPCLLFGGDTVWTQNGFTNIGKMKEKTVKHQNSRRHLANMISLSLLQKINTPDQPTEASEKLKNEQQMKELQEELSKVVDCLKFVAEFELDVRHKGSTLFNALENFLLNYSTDFKKHVSVFGKTSESVQNELLGHMLEVCRQQIISEVKEASYVAVICEDVADVSDKIKAVVVFRYEFHGVVRERFWGFLDNESIRADGVPKCLLREVHRLLGKKLASKLIARTLNMYVRSETDHMQSIYTNAHLTHSFSSDIDLTLKKMTKSVSSAKLFFVKLESLDSFFKKSEARLALLLQYTNSSTPPINNFDVCTVYKIKNNLIQCFEDIITLRITNETLEAASRFLTWLKNETFLFWLEMFNHITRCFKVLHYKVENCNPSELSTIIDEFFKSITKICNSFSLGLKGSSKISECQEVGTCICNQMKEKLSFTGHLSAAKLIKKENFDKFDMDIIKAEVKETCNAYPSLEEEKLNEELPVFYSFKKFQGWSPSKALQSLHKDNTLPETTKLLRIIATIPMGLNESEGCFSTVEQVKSLITDRIKKERLTALCMISAEEEMVSQIKNFNERVLQRYCDSGNWKFGSK